MSTALEVVEDEVIVPIKMDERPPTEKEAKAALEAIGARTSPEAVHAMQTIGCWAANVKIPQIMLCRQFTSFEQIDRAKKLCQTLMDTAAGDNEYHIQDPEMAVHALKSMSTVLAVENKMIETTSKLHDKCQPEKKETGGKNRLAPIALHLHQAAT